MSDEARSLVWSTQDMKEAGYVVPGTRASWDLLPATPPPAPTAPQRTVSAPVYAHPERVTPAGLRDHGAVDHRRPARPEYTALADRIDPAVWRPHRTMTLAAGR